MSVRSCLLLLLASSSAFAEIRVVQSVPVETQLSVSSIGETTGAWLELVRSARSSIDLEQFYVSNPKGASLEPVVKEIRAAAGRGVRVRFLFDYGFLKKDAPALKDARALASTIAGAEVRTVAFTKGIQHSKYLVVDGKKAYVGSANFDWRALTHIHEVGLVLDEAAAAAAVQRIFDTDWARGKELAFAPQEQEPFEGTVQVLASPERSNPSGVGATLPRLLSLLSSARKTLRVQVYQYGLGTGTARWTVLDDALRAAAKRGVAVQLLVDAVALKSASRDLQSLATVRGVEVKAVTLPTWSGGTIEHARVVHSKYVTVDGTSAWVGSENWQRNYFENSRNVGVLAQDQKIALDLESVFDQLWESKYARDVKSQ